MFVKQSLNLNKFALKMCIETQYNSILLETILRMRECTVAMLQVVNNNRVARATSRLYYITAVYCECIIML